MRGLCTQHYIELSSQYERPRPPVACSGPGDSELGGLIAASSRPASIHVARQQSMESGVFMSRPASSDLDGSPVSGGGYQRPVRSNDRTTYLPVVLAGRRRSQMSTDEGYLLPTTSTNPVTPECQQSCRQSVSNSDLCGSTESDNVFQHSTRV